MEPENPWISRFAKLAVIVTFLLIYLGGMVTSLNAGLSVPDWPTSFGYNMFTFPVSKWVGGIWWEHSHRLVASVLGLLTTILVLWIWATDRRRWVRALGVVAFLLVSIQGVLGGLRVTEISTTLAIVHGCLAHAFLCVITLLAMALSSSWKMPPTAEKVIQQARRLRPWSWMLTGAVLIQLVLGAVMRHLHAGLAIPTFPLTPGGTLMPTQHNLPVDINFAHRFWALVVAILATVLITKTLAAARTDGRLEGRLLRPALGLCALLVAQIMLGASVVWLGKAPIPTSLHVVVGAGVLTTGFILATWATRFASGVPFKGQKS